MKRPLNAFLGHAHRGMDSKAMRWRDDEVVDDDKMAELKIDWLIVEGKKENEGVGVSEWPKDSWRKLLYEGGEDYVYDLLP